MYWTAFKSEYILEHGVREHCRFFDFLKNSGLSELGVRGVHHILADQLTLYQPRGVDYAHHINIGTPEFSDLPTTL